MDENAKEAYKKLVDLEKELTDMLDTLEQNGLLTDDEIQTKYKEISSLRTKTGDTVFEYLNTLELQNYVYGYFGSKIVKEYKNNTEQTPDLEFELGPQTFWGIHSIVLTSVWTIRNIMHHFNNDDSSLQILSQLDEIAEQLLPTYNSLIVQLFEAAIFWSGIRLLQSPFADIYGNAAIALIGFAPRQPALSLSKADMLALLEMSDFAYGDFKPEIARAYGITPLSEALIPTQLQSYCGEGGNSLCLYDALRVSFFMWEEKIILAFAGTELTLSRWSTVVTDIIQLVGHSSEYAHAASLLKMFLDANPTKEIYVTGHSLGGGLAQFAAATNANEANRIFSVTFNPAGLSTISMHHLGTDRANTISNHVRCIRSKYDPVSVVGIQLGATYTLQSESIDSPHSLNTMRTLIDELPDTTII